MPQLSDTMSSGKILVWKKQEGQAVTRGDILAEVETDKANLEIEAFTSGTLIKIAIPAGSTAKVGEAIAYMGEAGEKFSGEAATAPAAVTAAKPATAAAPTPAAVIPASMPAPTRPVIAIAPDPAPQPEQLRHQGERVIASPLARKLAQDRNIDLRAVQGSGPNGRIVSRDLTSASQASSKFNETATPAARTSAAPAAVNVVPGSMTPLSKMRETIARRMQESVNQSPHFYSTVSIDMSQALKLREVLKENPQFEGISVNHLIIKAAAYALVHEPRVNAAMRENQLYQPATVNIGIITAIEDGLLIPVVKEADRLTLAELVVQSRAAIQRARAGKPNAQDLVGGTFSISNMGMFDVENFTAIINPGQGAVLAVSAVHQVPVVENNQVVVGQRMKVTLSVDHRVIDGIMAANFLKYFKQSLEIPALLMTAAA